MAALFFTLRDREKRTFPPLTCFLRAQPEPGRKCRSVAKTRYIRAHFHQDGIRRERADAGDVGQVNASNPKHLTSEIERRLVTSPLVNPLFGRGGISSGPPTARGNSRVFDSSSTSTSAMSD